MMESDSTMEDRHGVTLLWKIENFSYCSQNTEQRLESPHFCVDVLDKTMWYLRLYPRGCDGKNEVNAYLCFDSSSRMVMDYEIAFLSGRGSPLVVGQYKNKEIIPPWGYGIPTYPTQKEVFRIRKSEFLPQDTLTIRCRLWKSNQSYVRPAIYFARTRINVQRRSFLWTVPEFSKLQLNGKRVTHKVPTSVGRPPFNFELSVSGSSVTHARINIEIMQESNVLFECFGTCKISLLHAKGGVVKSLQDVHWFDYRDKKWRFPYFLSRNDLEAMGNKCLAGDELRLFCEFTITFQNDSDETESVCPVSTPNYDSILQFAVDEKKSDSLSVLQEDLLSLYKDRSLSDFELRSGDATFPVHKLVISARSPVFKAMLSSGMKEGSDNFLDIPDLDPDTLNRLLMFIYTGNVEDLDWSSASKLYYAAVKYEVLSLKQKCSMFLSNNITVNNVCEILFLADLHQDKDLKCSALDFIVYNDDKIIRSAQWKEFLANNPPLAAEAMQVIYSKKLDMYTVQIK